MNPTIRIAGVQMNIALGQPQTNVARMLAALREAAGAGAQLIVFPECAVSGYGFESAHAAREIAEPIDGPSVRAIQDECRQRGVYAVVGMLEAARGDAFYNSCVFLAPDGPIASYRKTHLPFLGVDRFTTPGEGPLAAFDTPLGRMGMNICYDGVFPEVARALALDGAELMLLPTNWPPGARGNSRHLVAARAMENRVFYLAVNRVGEEGGFPFIGETKLCGLAGETIAELPHAHAGILYAEIQPALAREKKIVIVPDRHETHRFHDRRPDLYGRLVAPI